MQWPKLRVLNIFIQIQVQVNVIPTWGCEFVNFLHEAR
jgi:hypothetical protein